MSEVELASIEDWTDPVQIRFREGRVEIRSCVKMGGISRAFYVRHDGTDDAEFWITTERIAGGQ